MLVGTLDGGDDATELDYTHSSPSRSGATSPSLTGRGSPARRSPSPTPADRASPQRRGSPPTPAAACIQYIMEEEYMEQAGTCEILLWLRHYFRANSVLATLPWGDVSRA